MNPSVLELELPAITGPDREVPLISSEEALRWRIEKHKDSKVLPRERPQGEPFVWIDEIAASSKQ